MSFVIIVIVIIVIVIIVTTAMFVAYPCPFPEVALVYSCRKNVQSGIACFKNIAYLCKVILKTIKPHGENEHSD